MLAEAERKRKGLSTRTGMTLRQLLDFGRLAKGAKK